MRNLYDNVLALRQKPAMLCVIIATLITLSVSYVNLVTRGVQGRLKSASDDIGGQFSAMLNPQRALQARVRDASQYLVNSSGKVGDTTQYEPYYLQTQYAATTAGASSSQLALEKIVIPSLRMLIQKANYAIRVEDVHQTFTAILALVERYNGIVVDSTIQEDTNGYISGITTFKVDPQHYGQVVGSLDALGKVETKNLSTEDVGEEFTDLNARMENAKVIRSRLYQIVNAKAGGIQEILQVEREIARVSEEIERYQGRINYLQSQSAMATITIHYYKTIAPQIPVWSINLKQKMIGTLRVACESFIGTFNAGILILAVVIPVVFWIVIVSLIFYCGQRMFFRKRT